MIIAQYRRTALPHGPFGLDQLGRIDLEMAFWRGRYIGGGNMTGDAIFNTQ